MSPMTRTFLHIAPGLVVLAAASLAVLALGARREKQVLTAVLVCWLGATAGQVLTQRLIEPLIAGDVVFAGWLLWFAWPRPAWWLYALFAVEGVRLMLHAFLYDRIATPWLPYRLANNTLSFLGLGVLVMASVMNRRGRGREDSGRAAGMRSDRSGS